MKNGDISNQAGITIAFRCEDSLIKFRESSLSDKLLNKLFGKVSRAEVNEQYRNTMEHLYRNTEFNVDLVVNEENYTPALQELLDEMPFNRVVLVKSDAQVYSRLLVGDISYYIDENTYRLGLVNSPFAGTLKELYHLILKGRNQSGL